LKSFKQYISFDFIHFGTDVYNENPQIVVSDKELQSKLFLDWKKLRADKYTESIIDDSASDCELLNFLKVKVCSIIY